MRYFYILQERYEKMKTRRILSLILASLMLSVSMLSCAQESEDGNNNNDTPSGGNESKESATETESETEPELTDGLEDKNFNGYDFRILSVYWKNDDSAHFMMYEDITGNPVNDALNASMNYIENRFNIKYDVISGGDEFNTQTTVRSTINAGDDIFDITIGHDGLTFTLAKEGLFYNMMDVEQFDFTKPWWPDGTVNSLSLLGKLYCASNYMTYTGLHWTRAMIVNKDYANDIGLEIPYDTVREGKWTTDEFMTLVNGRSQDLDGNGKIDEDDRVAYASGGETAYCLQESNGINLYPRDEEGVPYLDIDLEKITTFVDKWRGLMSSQDYRKDGAFATDLFEKGNVLFCYGQIGDAYDRYRNTDIRYGFLPTPKYDEAQANYINCCTDLPWAIPKTVKGEQIDIIGTLCEAISCYNYKNVLPAYFDVAMKSRTAETPDDAEMLQLIADTRTISFAHAYGLKFARILDDIGENSTAVASYFKTSQKVAAKELDKIVKTFEKAAGEAGA